MAGREEATQGADVKADLERLRADVAGLSDTLQKLASESGRQAYQRVRAGADQVRGQAEAAAKAVGHEIEERPLMSVLIAFAIGFIIGKLFDRR